MAKKKHNKVFDSLNLLKRDEGEYVWATYDEIAGYYAEGFVLFNDNKRKVFEKTMAKKRRSDVARGPRVEYSRKTGVNISIK
ncbi:MAG: hypothetical protein PVG39_04700 [Desulfobacteraceae bacterium]|jgi:hypothetical protein